MKKARTIKLRRELGGLFGDVTIAAGGTELSSGNYHLVGGDLRAWPTVVERLVHYGFDPAAPTLFVSECVFIYITPPESSAILDWITQNMSDAAFMLYEQILPDDSFGRMMIRNLQASQTTKVGEITPVSGADLAQWWCSPILIGTTH